MPALAAGAAYESELCLAVAAADPCPPPFLARGLQAEQEVTRATLAATLGASLRPDPSSSAAPHGHQSSLAARRSAASQSRPSTAHATQPPAQRLGHPSAGEVAAVPAAAHALSRPRSVGGSPSFVDDEAGSVDGGASTASGAARCVGLGMGRPYKT